MSRYTIEQLRSLPIVDVVNKFYSDSHLKKMGGVFKMVCPFHTEKTPSFIITPSINRYHCFGCGEGGNTIDFVKKIENLEFYGAVKLLGQAFSIPIESTPGEERRNAQRKNIQGIYDIAIEYYHNNLFGRSDEQKQALTYLRSRFSEDSIKKWKLGFASQRGFSSYVSNDFSSDLLLQSGLVKESEQDVGQHYDFFRNRVLFPIKNSFGKVVAFGGRSLDGSEPKYINSSENPIYKKSEILYGIDKAIKAIRTTKKAIVVEGFADVVVNHEFGIENCVATIGTSLTESHLRTLSNIAEDIFLCYDPDKGGISSAERVGKLALSDGISLKLVNLKEGDPDEFLIKHGVEEYLRTVNAGVGVFDFALESRGLQNIKEVSVRYNKTKELYEFVDACKDTLLKSLSLQNIANRLELDERVLVKDYITHVRGNRNNNNKRNIEDLVLGLLAYQPIYRRAAKTKIIAEDFSKPEYGMFFNFLCSGKSVDDAVIRPRMKLEIGTLFAEAENTDLFKEFKDFCDQSGFIIHENQLSSLEGVVMKSINDDPHILTLMENELLIRDIKEIEQRVKEAYSSRSDELDELLDLYNKKLDEYNTLNKGNDG